MIIFFYPDKRYTEETFIHGTYRYRTVEHISQLKTRNGVLFRMM